MYLRREDRGVVDRMWLHGGTPRLDVRAGMGMGSVPEASGELTCSTGNGARGYVSRCSEGVVVIDRWYKGRPAVYGWAIAPDRHG